MWRLCSGVCRRRIDLVGRCVFWPFGSRIKKQFRVVWKFGEWTWFAYLPAASVVGGELVSMVVGAWGVSPADVVQATASSRSGRVSTAATSKASWRLGLLLTWDPWWRSSGDGRRQRSQVDSIGRVSKDLFVISMFGRGLCVKGRDSSLLYPSRMYLYVYCLCTP